MDWPTAFIILGSIAAGCFVLWLIVKAGGS